MWNYVRTTRAHGRFYPREAEVTAKTTQCVNPLGVCGVWGRRHMQWPCGPGTQKQAVCALRDSKGSSMKTRSGNKWTNGKFYICYYTKGGYTALWVTAALLMECLEDSGDCTKCFIVLSNLILIITLWDRNYFPFRPQEVNVGKLMPSWEDKKGGLSRLLTTGP